MGTYTVRFTQQYKIVLALIVPALIIVPCIYLVAKYLPNLSDGATGAAMCVIVGLPIAITFYLVKRATPLVEMQIGSNTWQFNFVNAGFTTPSDFELNTSDIISFSVEVTSKGYYFTITSNTAPYRFSISAASNSEEDNNRFAELIEKVSIIIDARNEKSHLEKKVTVAVFRNIRWFWAMIIFSVVFFVLVMVVQMVKG